MVQVSLSTTTTFDGDLNALVEELGTSLTVRFDLDEPAPEGGLRVYVDSEVEQIINRLDLPGFVASPTLENIDLASLATNFDNSGFAVTIDEGATFGSFTINVFDNPEPDTFLPETFDGLVEAALSLRTQAEVDPAAQNDITGLGDYTVDPSAASSTVIFADDASQLMDVPEPPEPPTPPTPPTPDGLQVSLFAGPDYLIEDEGTVSAHAFLATNGVIPEGGLVVSVDAPNLSEFGLAGISVEGGEIEAVRDGGFDLRMLEYTTLVNLPIASDGEAEAGETATFSLAAGSGYQINENYSGNTFNLVDTRSDISLGVVTEPNDIVSVAVDTQIAPDNPSFSAADAIYFDIGNRYPNGASTYTYVGFSQDVDLYQVELSAGDTIATELFEVEGNADSFFAGLSAFDSEGNQLIFATDLEGAAPNKLFGSAGSSFNEDGTVNENQPQSYIEFTAPDEGIYYIAVATAFNTPPTWFGRDNSFSIETIGEGDANRAHFGNYEIAIDLLTPDNPRNTGMPTSPVSNPGVISPPTLSLSANPTTVDSEGNFTNAAVEFVEDDGISGVNFTIRAEGDIPEGGIEFVLNSDVNLFNYASYTQQGTLPSTIGGQSLGAFYNEDGIPTGIRLLIEKPTMTVNLARTSPSSENRENFGYEIIYDQFESLETDGAEDVTFFLQSGEGYEVAADAGTTEVTYYDSLEDVPPPTGGGDTVPEVGVSISESTLIESEGTETTLTFTLSAPPPEEGVVVFLDSDDQTSIGSVLGQFLVLEAEVEGGNFPVPNSDSSGFFFTITEQTAAITLPVFDELTVIEDPLTVQEGILDLTFTLQPQEGYTIDSNANEINLTILDNPDSQIQVGLLGSTEGDEASTTLIESEETVSVHTFILSASPPEEGLTVNVSADSLDDFDLDAIEVQGGTIANLSDDGFDLTITEWEATINLPVAADEASEGSETATFTLEPSNNYQIDQAATEATFAIVDTPDQVAGVSEEIEDNSTLSQANALSVSTNNPTVSISGTIAGFGLEQPDRVSAYPEDVDFYAVALEAGQTITFDIDTGEPAVVAFDFLVFPELRDVPQQVDTELRLFDVEGNELASNNDGAAPDEEFSRDPFIEYTAESSGTYYIGVSQLGNRNYDPNIARSGSGWTFPEVGILTGDFFDPARDYELTVSLIDSDGGGTVGGLTGTDGADMLIGTDGDDLLDGLLGDDTYTGGAGADQFTLAIAQGVDTITDFEVGIDQISLGGLTPEGVKFFELSSDTLVLTASNELIGVVQGVTELDSSVFA